MLRSFRNRADAGQQLASRLMHLKIQAPVVLALPRGGVPVAFEIAQALQTPLDLVMVRKIGSPWQPELAAAAVVDGDDPQIVENPDVMAMLRLTEDFIKTEAARELKEIERRRSLYLSGRTSIPLKGRAVILVDDGIATGATARAALKAVRKAGAEHVVLAVPVAPPDTVAALRPDADEIVCLSQPAYFGGISQFYADFHQVGDDEVISLLNRASTSNAARPQVSGPSDAPVESEGPEPKRIEESLP
jgi:putative phosphoribosyl transferase